MRHRIIYLDNSTTTRPSEKSISAMMPFLTDMWGHSSAPHQKGQQLVPALKQNLKSLYTSFGVDESDTIIVTSSGTEAVNQVIQSVYHNVTLSTGKNQYLTSSLDEASSIRAIGRLESFGCVGKMVPASKEGYIQVKDLIESISPRTALISLSWANGLTGVIQPIKEIASLCKQRGIQLHLDASHVFGKLFYDLKEIGADYITLNGDTIHAPKGTGILYIKKGIKSSPLLLGGAEQSALRAGVINIPGLAALTIAAEEALESRDYLCTEIARLRDKLEQGILKGYPNAQVLFKDQDRVPHITTIAFNGIVNEALLFRINRQGVCGCMGGNDFQQLGLLLQECGVDTTTAQSAISFSLSRYTTEEEIDHAIAIIIDNAQLLAKIAGKIKES